MAEEKTEKQSEEKKAMPKKIVRKPIQPKKRVEQKPGHAEVKTEQKAEVVKHVPAPVVKTPQEVPKEPQKVEAKPEVKPEKRPKKKHAASKSGKVVVIRGKRKESVARATIQKGMGVIRVNKLNVEALNNKYVRDFIKEPMKFLGPEANNVNISVTVCGGGTMGQAQAARTAIANALVEYFDDKSLYDKMYAFDKFLLIEDSRRVEPKKYKGPKARARFQKSYR